MKPRGHTSYRRCSLALLHFYICCERGVWSAFTHTQPKYNLCIFTSMLLQKHMSGFILQQTATESFSTRWSLTASNPLRIHNSFSPFFHLAAGIIEAVARDFFNSKVTMVVLNQSEEDERTGKKEHVVFLVKETHQASKTRDLDHSSYREVGVWGCTYVHDLFLYVFIICVLWFLAHMCSVWLSPGGIKSNEREVCVTGWGKEWLGTDQSCGSLRKRLTLSLYIAFIILKACSR